MNIQQLVVRKEFANHIEPATRAVAFDLISVVHNDLPAHTPDDGIANYYDVLICSLVVYLFDSTTRKFDA